MFYTEDCLCNRNNGERVLTELEIYFPPKPGSTAPLNIYLGGKVSKNISLNGVEAYAFSSSRYMKNNM